MISSHEHSGTEEYAFLSGLVALLRPESVLEIGTASGDGTLAFASAMNGGRIVTVDIEDQRGQELLDYSGPADIRFIEGDSAEIVRALADKGDSFDLAFIDGGHHFDQVKADWEAVREICSTVLFHDALQFSGVSRVIEEIRHSADWDVSVLDYPPVRSVDSQGKTYRSNRVPGIAIATRKKESIAPDLKGLPGSPAADRKTVLSRWEKSFEKFLAADTPEDLGRHDLEMILHLLRDIKPEFICHIGHVGTAASFLFHEYARKHQIPALFMDLGGFYEAKRARLPESLAGILEVSKFKENDLKQIWEGKNSGLLWIDPWDGQEFYNHNLPSLLANMPAPTTAAIRNFSPDHGQPKSINGPDRSICTNPNAHRFCSWLDSSRTVEARLARPELVFDDYLNAGHWIYLRRI